VFFVAPLCWPSGCGEHQIIEEYAEGSAKIIKKLRRHLNLGRLSWRPLSFKCHLLALS
jgi:hypothetical protein